MAIAIAPPQMSIDAKLSHLAQRLLYLNGKPFSLADFPMYEAIYDGRFQSTLLMCGRQVAKSTSMANFIIAESVAIPHFNSYYVSPSREQTITFSNTRLRKTMSYSPLINKYYQSPGHSDRVLSVAYTNGSENAFTYACTDADRARGFSADRVLYDEVQDMLYTNVVPVINACMLHSKYQFEMYAGTPKTMESSIQYLWENSTQSEWVMKCESCGTYCAVMSEKSIGPDGPMCLKCGHVLNPRKGYWQDFKAPVDGQVGQLTKGFHIPQAIMPENIPSCMPSDYDNQKLARKKWDNILKARDMWSPARFRNEILGVSDAIGQRLVSLEELKALCVGNEGSSTWEQAKNPGVMLTVAGVDWTGGGTKKQSRTVLWVWGWHPGTATLRCLFHKIYPNNNATVDVEDIVRICKNYSVSMVVGDSGEGNLPNDILRKALGHQRVNPCQYGSNKIPMKWNGVDRWFLDRSTVIDNFMMFLKQRHAIRPVFPPYAEAAEAIKDILNEYEEVTLAGKKVWMHSPDLPDDALHAALFGWIAFKIVARQLTFDNI